MPIIVTHLYGLPPRVLVTDGPLPDVQREARDISNRNGKGAVVYILEDDGEDALYQYHNGVETDLRPQPDVPAASLLTVLARLKCEGAACRASANRVAKEGDAVTASYQRGKASRYDFAHAILKDALEASGVRIPKESSN